MQMETSARCRAFAALARRGYVEMTMRPSPSTPHVTGDNCGRPSARVVTNMPRWRGRMKSSNASRSTRRAVAIFGDTRLLGPAQHRDTPRTASAFARRLVQDRLGGLDDDSLAVDSTGTVDDQAVVTAVRRGPQQAHIGASGHVRRRCPAGADD